jgi:hypothetical protein
MGCLEIMQVPFVDPDCLLELLDVLGPALSKGRLCLSIPLLPLLGRRIYLPQLVNCPRKHPGQRNNGNEAVSQYQRARCAVSWIRLDSETL